MGTRWGPADDANKLTTLWRTPHNRVDSTKLDKDSVKAVHQAHFAHTKYANFDPLYRGKARAFNVSNTLDGHRKRSAAHKAAEAGRVNLEDISDDDSDPFEEADDPRASDDEDKDRFYFPPDDDEREDMGKSTPKRTPQKKKGVAHSSSAGADTSEDALAARMEDLNINVPMFSMDYKMPFILTTYNEGLDQMCTIQILTVTMPKDSFIPDVVDGGKRLEVRILVPSFFVDETRILDEKRGVVTGFNKNTHEAQAFRDVCETIDSHYGMQAIIFGEPMSIALPFICEERVVQWEIQAHVNQFGELTDELGGQQFMACVAMKLRKLKTKRKTTGAFRVIGEVPGRMDEDEAED